MADTIPVWFLFRAPCPSPSGDVCAMSDIENMLLYFGLVGAALFLLWAGWKFFISKIGGE